MLNERDSAWLAGQIRSMVQTECEDKTKPSVLFRPAVSIDGDQWCALYGENLQDGIAGFGDTVGDAMSDFDTNWWNHKARQTTDTPNRPED